jgi:geranylgeranyl transferase type-1 subunit beta
MYPCMWPFVVTALPPLRKPTTTNLASFRHFAFSGRYKYLRNSPTTPKRGPCIRSSSRLEPEPRAYYRHYRLCIIAGLTLSPSPCQAPQTNRQSAPRHHCLTTLPLHLVALLDYPRSTRSAPPSKFKLRSGTDFSLGRRSRLHAARFLSTMAPTVFDANTQLNYARHIKYWRRNLKTLLPHFYTSNDSNRMLLALFTVSALDILGDLDAALSAEERQGHIEWVYSCQLPEGGFRPWPGSNYGVLRSEENKNWDPAHIPGTFFALLTLVVLGDDLERVKRKEILIWLLKMQRPEGSFGETLGDGDYVHGGNDSRFGYMATAIRWILRGDLEGPCEGVPDINVDNFVACVRRAECYDGGISEAPYHEAHAGFTCCAIAALAFLGRLPLPPSQKPDGVIRGVTDVPRTLHWLVSRQTLTLDEDDGLDTLNDETDSSETCHDAHTFVKLGAYPSAQANSNTKGRPHMHFELEWVGMNGRCNKVADTCYAYWTCTPLQLLGHLDIVDTQPIRKWLLDKTQHLVGGFGKVTGDPPDMYHSFLGLIVLAMFGETGLQDVDPALCITLKAKKHLESLSWRRKILSMDNKSSGAKGASQESIGLAGDKTEIDT